MAVIRMNFNAYEDGEEYQNRLEDEATRNFKILLTLLSSYWQSTIDGPNYARDLKATALALARIRIGLDDIRTDTYFKNTRGEYLYQVVSSMLFPKSSGAPDPNLSDLDFRDFLQKVVGIYFAGSVPPSMQKVVELFVNGQVVVRENFLEARKPGSGFDISDEFGFSVDVLVSSPSSTDVFLANKNIRILLNIIRPAHTLYRLRYILQDVYTGHQSDTNPHKILDSSRSSLINYGYEDFRKFTEGVYGIDEKGTKKNQHVSGEDHSSDF